VSDCDSVDRCRCHMNIIACVSGRCQG
jgi:hypothetical protein